MVYGETYAALYLEGFCLISGEPAANKVVKEPCSGWSEKKPANQVTRRDNGRALSWSRAVSYLYGW